MKDSYTILAWENCQERFKNLDMRLDVKSNCIFLFNKRGERLGAFRSVRELEQYMYGYESGLKDRVLYLNG